jgi:hypothetical protein
LSGGTSLFASQLVGLREAIYTSKSKTRQPGNWSESETTSEHRAVESALMASEIERLPDLQGFLKLTSSPDWQRVRLKPVNYPEIVRTRRPDASAGEPGLKAGPASPNASTGVIPPEVSPVKPMAAAAPAAKKRPRKSSAGVTPSAGVPGEGGDLSARSAGERADADGESQPEAVKKPRRKAK